MTTFLYLLIPVTSAVIGWATNVMAIFMMFRPIEFVGKRPFWGWQGVIPANAHRMAGIAVDLLLEKLLPVEEIAARLDARRIAEAMKGRTDLFVEELVPELMREKVPKIWEALPLRLKDSIVARIREEAPGVITDMVDEAKSNVRAVFDLRKMMVETLIRDKALLNEIFLTAGEKEFEFLRRSGLYFGFLFGLPSMLVWIGFHTWWTLPIGGLFVGWATNWLALTLMFEPKEPVKIGPFVWQGLFLRRQQEVSAAYAKLVAAKILTAQGIAETLLRDPSSDRLFRIVERHVNRAVDTQAGIAKPLLVLRFGTEDYVQLKARVCDRVLQHLPESASYAYAYADDAMDIERTIRDNMQALAPAEFEGVLRPAYQQDEAKLIMVGAILGGLAGLMQLSFL